VVTGRRACASAQRLTWVSAVWCRIPFILRTLGSHRAIFWAPKEPGWTSHTIRCRTRASACGGVRRCHEAVCATHARYAARRQVSTGFARQSISLTHMSELAAAITASSFWSRHLRVARRRGPVPGPHGACKVPLRMARFATDRLVSCSRSWLHGANLVPQLARDARLLRVFEGPRNASILYRLHCSTARCTAPFHCRRPRSAHACLD